MVDLSEAGRSVRSDPGVEAPPLEAVRARVGLVTRRRRRRAVTVPVVVAVVVVGIALALTAGRTDGPTVTRPAHEGGTPPVTLPDVHAPAGWQPADMGDVRLWLPSDWETFGACARKRDDGGAVSDPAAPGTPTFPCGPDSVELRRISGSPTGAHTMVNGLPARRSTPDAWGTVQLDVPPLGLSLIAHGTGAEVLAHVGPSSRRVVLGERRASSPPDGWRTESVLGVQLSVPPDWPRSRQDERACWANGPWDSRPGLYWNEGWTSVTRCAWDLSSRPADGVLITPSPSSVFQPAADRGYRLLRTAPSRIWVEDDEDERLAPPVVRLLVEVPNAEGSHHEVRVEIGTGVDPSTAERILDSLASTPAPSHVTADRVAWQELVVRGSTGTTALSHPPTWEQQPIPAGPGPHGTAGVTVYMANYAIRPRCEADGASTQCVAEANRPPPAGEIIMTIGWDPGEPFGMHRTPEEMLAGAGDPTTVDGHRAATLSSELGPCLGLGRGDDHRRYLLIDGAALPGRPGTSGHERMITVGFCWRGDDPMLAADVERVIDSIRLGTG